MKNRTEGHTETTISGDTRADWSAAFELAPSLKVAYVWHASVFTREVLRTVAPEIFDQPHTRTKKAALTLRERSRHVEADEIRAALAACDGDRDAVCQALGISKTTLWRKLNAAQ